jgi:hypothetical protein
MSQPHFACPVCNTPVQDNTIRCKQCNWMLGIDRELSPEIQCELHAWASFSYKLAIKSEKNEYNYQTLNSRFDRQRDEIENINDDLNSFKKLFPQVFHAIDEIKDILTTNQKTSARGSSDIEVEEVSTNTIDLEQAEFAKEEFTSISKELTPAQQEIISDYYHSPKEFSAKYQTRIANITKDSINSNRGSEDKTIVLEETSQGNYWIFDFGDCNYLVPVEDKYINPHRYTTTSSIFDSHNYTTDYQKIQLIKPAIVSIDPNTNPQTWRLQQQGELVFL